MLSAGRSKPAARRTGDCQNRTVVLDLIGPPSSVWLPSFLTIPNSSSPVLISSQVF
jgi:hypothetical protein